MQSLWDLPIAQTDVRFRAWLLDFSDSGQRLTGVNPMLDLAIAGRVRRWYLSGLSVYEAVKRWQA